MNEEASPHPALLARLLKQAPLRALGALAQLEPGAYTLEGLRPQCVFITEPSLVELVLADSEQRFRKASLPNHLRWLVGDGTAASGLPRNSEAGWDALRSTKRLAVLPLLAPPSPQSVQDAVGELILKPGLAFDAFGLLYEVFFLLAWRLLFGREKSPEVMRACRHLRSSALAVSLALRSSHCCWAPYHDRSLQVDPAWWRFLPGSRSITLQARRRSLDLLLREILDDAPQDAEHPSAPFKIRNWSKSVDGVDPEVAARFACVGLLFASFENSAATAAWLLWLLADRPEWQERLVACLPSTRQMMWDGCINEALRLFPPVWSVAREASAAFRWRGRFFASGTVFVVSPWVQGRLVAGWTRPNAFQPERWSHLAPPGLFIPFGAGPRACPGASFALQEIKVVMASLLSGYRFEAVTERAAPVPLFGQTQRPRGGVWLRAWPR